MEGESEMVVNQSTCQNAPEFGLEENQLHPCTK